MWLAVRVDTSVASNSLTTPLPGRPASLQITVNSDLFCLTNSSTRRSGVPTPMNPPTMTVAPLGIMATASSAETLFILANSNSLGERRAGSCSVETTLTRFDLFQRRKR